MLGIQTLGYVVMLAGFIAAWLMHHGSKHGTPAKDPAASGGADVPGGRRLLHEEGGDPARHRVAEMHEAVAYVVLALVTLQVRPGRLKVTAVVGGVPS